MSKQRMRNSIWRQLYLHVFDIKASIFGDIGNIFTYTLNKAYILCNLMEIFFQIAQKDYYRSKALNFLTFFYQNLTETI